MLDPAADRPAGRTGDLRRVPCGGGALRWCAGRGRLWTRRADCRIAAQIWAANGARAADGAIDGAPAGGAGGGRADIACPDPAAPLAALVARVQSGRADRRRTDAACRHSARPSPAAPDEGDQDAARAGTARARTDRCGRFRAGSGSEGKGGGPPPRADRRRPRERRDPARGRTGIAAERRGAHIRAHLGARRPGCIDDEQHI